MHLTLVDGERDALEDLLAFDAGSQVSELKISQPYLLPSLTSYVQSGAASPIQVDRVTSAPSSRWYISCSFWQGKPVRAATSWIGQLQWRIASPPCGSSTTSAMWPCSVASLASSRTRASKSSPAKRGPYSASRRAARRSKKRFSCSSERNSTRSPASWRWPSGKWSPAAAVSL